MTSIHFVNVRAEIAPRLQRLLEGLGNKGVCDRLSPRELEVANELLGLDNCGVQLRQVYGVDVATTPTSDVLVLLDISDKGLELLAAAGAGELQAFVGDVEFHGEPLRGGSSGVETRCSHEAGDPPSASASSDRSDLAAQAAAGGA